MKWTKDMADDARGREIDCERARTLLPLYAAGDLDEGRGREVGSHVETCEPCRGLAAEFDASRRLVAEALATPEFGAEFYAAIRGDVLARVGRGGDPSSPTSFVAALFFGRRLAYA